ncbi:MAG: DUF29 domain-containing protein [Alphaproteobacteria bacterium]|nr:DUF29 domain-containing protein [Alphaproteobacteria bacterium]
MSDAKTLHDQDFLAWSKEQAKALRVAAGTGSTLPLDWENLAEEVEDLGRATEAELVSHLAVLLLHLLKWEFQPERRGRSWELSIVEQREQIEEHLTRNPSLRPRREEALAAAYKKASRRAERETGLPASYFPWAPKYSFEEVMSTSFWPGPE